MIRREVAHVSDPNQIEAAPVRPENLVTSWLEDGSLPDSGPRLQVPEPTALAEVADQVYENVLRKEVRHSLDTRDPYFVEVHVQDPKDNGAPEALRGLLQARQVLQRQQR